MPRIKATREKYVLYRHTFPARKSTISPGNTFECWSSYGCPDESQLIQTSRSWTDRLLNTQIDDYWRRPVPSLSVSHYLLLLTPSLYWLTGGSGSGHTASVAPSEEESWGSYQHTSLCITLALTGYNIHGSHCQHITSNVPSVCPSH